MDLKYLELKYGKKYALHLLQGKKLLTIHALHVYLAIKLKNRCVPIFCKVGKIKKNMDLTLRELKTAKQTDAFNLFKVKKLKNMDLTFWELKNDKKHAFNLLQRGKTKKKLIYRFESWRPAKNTRSISGKVKKLKNMDLQ